MAQDERTNLSFRSRALPAVNTLWVDVSTILILPGYISGITRTIRKIVECWIRSPWTNIKFCAVTEKNGFVEVDRKAVFPEGIPSDSRNDPKSSSRFWYLPWQIRHGMRKFWMDPDRSTATPQKHRQDHSCFLPYQPGSVLGPVNLGPQDLFFSLGGLWIVPEIGRTLKSLQEQLQFKFVSLVYDLIPWMAPHFCSPKLVLPTFTPCTTMQLQSSDVILTISEYSRQDILKHAKQHLLPIGPVEVFTLGSNIQPLSAADSGPVQHCRPFVLSVGSVEVRKNHLGMYQAWRKLLKLLGPDRTPDLVFAGKQGWQGDSILYLVENDPLVRGKIIVKDGIGDKELDWLYKNCLFTLYPSLYEGWGLPVEESFIYGKLCITTNATSLPEVGREFADYIEPEDVDAIVKGVIRALDEPYRRDRERLIREKYKPNTWQQATDQLQGILESHFTFPKLASRHRRRAA